ncbi:aliphatic sulfonate ABC transporter substrate-binding protein [Neomegalonema sp.]|uniref:aliphatic sulfonate ABC transporter substrate-binding protein n=1 Tax=Neomegalonema sp. TaxID=2039713 RepID=UPI00261C795E|nr:aliphatic sulfonate ABC transporter substrate-binding protein [Neomegalonema sp.]MDD2869342.1 aliphatic sulfonate ABC transporter substrate-binding protein [Neomegalonema sp.]
MAARTSPFQAQGGIRTAEIGRSRILAFDEPTRAALKTSIRATAMILADPASRAIQEDLDRLAPSDMTVLVLGETGAGKELVARYLHANSPRREGPFVAVNCGAFTESLAEAELFGHEKGAFTGALRNQPGWFEAAHGGTLLLDEIGDLPPHLQVKLLRVLQEQEVTRVGSRRPVAIDVRVVAATNVDLGAAVREKRFREDLFFRLNVARVNIPPLRERPSDIAPLARHFLDLRRARAGRPDLEFSPAALAALERHSWPGNIRELENVVQSALHMARGPMIEAGDLNLAAHLPREEAAGGGLEERVALALRKAAAAGEPEIFQRTLSSLVRAACELSGGNQVRAAALLGIPRHSLRTHLTQMGMLEPGRRGAEARRAAPEEPRVLNIGYQKYGAGSILKSKGTLERRLAERGIRVSWTEFSAGPQLLKALGAGAVDFGATGEAPPILAQAAGASLVYLAHDPPAPRGEAILVRGDSGLRDASGLKGRKVGLNFGSNVHYLLIRALQRHGLTLDDVRQVDLSPDDEPLRLLENGEIDAWAIWDPILSAALHAADVKVLTDGGDLAPNRQFYLGRPAYVAANGETVATLLQELRTAGEQAVRHAPGMARMLAQEIKLDAMAVETALRRMSFGANPLDDAVVAEQQLVADRLYESGLLAAPILVSDAVATLGR